MSPEIPGQIGRPTRAERSAAQIQVVPGRVFSLLVGVVVLLVVASTAGQLTKYLAGHDQVFGFVPKLFVGTANTVPTWFSSALLLGASALLATIALVERGRRAPFARHSLGLALIFLYISMDETASIHEMAISPVRHLLGTGGLLYFAWVIPAALLLVVLAVWYWSFLFHYLPPRSHALFLLSAVLYVGGAMGVELLGGRFYEAHGANNLTYPMLQTLEETLEMLGVTVFIYALPRYLAAEIGAVRLVFGDAAEGISGPP